MCRHRLARAEVPRPFILPYRSFPLVSRGRSPSFVLTQCERQAHCTESAKCALKLLMAESTRISESRGNKIAGEVKPQQQRADQAAEQQIDDDIHV
jgi:hypothetical protein